MKLFLLGLACFGATLFLAIVGNLIIIVSAGPTVAAGERAVVIAGIFDLVLWIACGVCFWFLARPFSLPARIGSTLALLFPAAFTLALILLVTILMLNR